MAIPDYQTLMLPLLKVLKDGRPRNAKEITDLLAGEFGLTESERSQTMPTGNHPVLDYRIAWGKTHLKKAGLIENTSRGIVRITDTGKNLLAEGPKRIDYRLLRRYPSYLQFIGRAEDQEPAEASEPPRPADPEAVRTPLELIDLSYQAIRRAAIDDVLTRLKSCSPAFFERVVLQLLEALGYGISGKARLTGGSGDGGIDGVIWEDKLGLDTVCVQAKRWESSVGRPVVQAFVGSMDLHRAKKGVILTTSEFSTQAIDFTKIIDGKKVALVDGMTLAGLMFDHNVGVKRTADYELKEVSGDYFDESGE